LACAILIKLARKKAQKQQQEKSGKTKPKEGTAKHAIDW